MALSFGNWRLRSRKLRLSRRPGSASCAAGRVGCARASRARRQPWALARLRPAAHAAPAERAAAQCCLGDDESLPSPEAGSFPSPSGGPFPARPAARRRAFGGPAGPGYQTDDSPVPSLATASTSGSEAGDALPAPGASTFLAQKPTRSRLESSASISAGQWVVGAGPVCSPPDGACGDGPDEPPVLCVGRNATAARAAAALAQQVRGAVARGSLATAPTAAPGTAASAPLPGAAPRDGSPAAEIRRLLDVVNDMAAGKRMLRRLGLTHAAALRVHDSRPVMRAATAASAAPARPGPRTRSSARDQRP